jgi:hypothetical protein
MQRRNLFKFSMGAALTLASAAALAQFGRRGKGGQGSKGGEQASSLEITLHEFEEDLKLTADQQSLWGTYVDRIRALASDVARERRQAAPAQPLLQRIDRVVDVARDRLTAVEDIALAAKALYAKLNPQQQEIADPRLANIILMPLAGAQAPNAERTPRDRGPVSN